MKFTKLKKVLSIFMLVAMVIGMLPTTAWAQAPQPEWAEWNETADDAVTVTATVSKDGAVIIGNDAASTRLNRVTVTVPYFDLALYGLEAFHRTPADDPNGEVIQRPTMLHAQIYLLERYYFGLAEEECGKGNVDLSQNQTAYVESVGGTQALVGSGPALAALGSARSMWQSSFWGCDSSNVHYFRNHADGLIHYDESDATNTSGWYSSISATADYFLLEDGDTIDLAVFTTSPWNGIGGNAYMENYETTENVTIQAGESCTWKADFFDTNWMNNSEVPLNWHVYNESGEEVYVSEGTSLEFTYTFEDAGNYTVVGYDAAYGSDSCIVLPAAASVTVTEPAAEPLPYTDVNESDWHLPYVEDVYQKNLMTGLNETTFGPNENLSRAQFAVILYRMEDSPEVSYSNTYPDIADDIWYTDAVMWASEHGIVTGYSHNGCFGPADDITREQMATMLYRYAQYKGYDTDTLTDLTEYLDADKVSEFAETGMAWCVENEIISGDGITGELLPQGVTSRAVCAAMISRFTDTF